ncbi:MAG: helix-turn-helix domain-containing protein [Candidatus Bathyarchaeia archaeon]
MALDEDYIRACLVKLGLTEYEARIYTVLVRMGQRTASEIGFLGKIPRPKTYGSIKSLELKGFIKVIPSKPERYVAVAPNKILLPLVERLAEDVERCKKVLDDLALSFESSQYIHMEEPYERRELWGFHGREQVQRKILKMVNEAKDSVFNVTSANGAIRICKSLFDAFEEAVGRNLDVRVIAPLTPENEPALRDLKEVIKVKTTTLPLPNYVCADANEILFIEAIPDNHDIKEGRDIGSLTDDPSLVRLHREFFLKLWQII